jgi:hypothetical protein
MQRKFAAERCIRLLRMQPESDRLDAVGGSGPDQSRIGAAQEVDL